MSAQAPRSAGAGDAERTTSADSAVGHPAPVAVSPALEPLPPIYIPQWPSQQDAVSLLRRAVTGAVRRAVRSAFRRLPHNQAETLAGEPHSSSPASHVLCQRRR